MSSISLRQTVQDRSETLHAELTRTIAPVERGDREWYRDAIIYQLHIRAFRDSDADGIGSLPANPYDLTTEYGRASGDIRHRFVMTGNFRAPWGINVGGILTSRSGTFLRSLTVSEENAPSRS